MVENLILVFYNIDMKKLLLHSCCGPCSTTAITRLSKDYDVTVYYYNPNIYPNEEFIKRQETQKQFLREYNPHIELIEGEWENDLYETNIKGLEKCKEGGERCSKCFYLRLYKTALLAKKLGYDMFATTLTVSPHKNSKVINAIGETISQEVGIEYLPSDFKKQDGYLESIKLSKEYGLYRQNYCGCKYSMWWLEENQDNK